MKSRLQVGLCQEEVDLRCCECLLGVDAKLLLGNEPIAALFNEGKEGNRPKSLTEKVRDAHSQDLLKAGDVRLGKRPSKRLLQPAMQHRA